MALNINRVVRTIRHKQWYRQGAAALPWFISPPWSTLVAPRAFGKQLPVSFGSVVLWMANGQVEMYWPTKMMVKVSAYYVRRQQRDGRFLARLHSNWKQEDWPAFQRLVLTLHSTKLRELSDRELRREFLLFLHRYIATWAEGVFHDAFDFTGDRLVQQVSSLTKRKATTRDIELLLRPDRPLSINVEERTLAKLARQSLTSPALRPLILRRAWPSVKIRSPRWYAAVIRHQNRYFWMYNDYAHVRDLLASVFLNRIRDLLRNPVSLRNALNISQALGNVRSRQQKVERRIGLTVRQRRTLELLRIVQVWRDERKAMNQQGSSAMQRFVLEFSRRSGLPIDLVRQSFWWEFDRLLAPTGAFRSLLRKRSRGALHVTTRTKNIPGVTGKQAFRLLRTIRRTLLSKGLQGRPAFPGVVRGIARMMLKQSDFPSFKKGQILIAPNTRPEYVPIMKKAAAIVTEEGGITSHAAIISRELKIPAVVGVQGILDVVKNGDLIEVDATKGIVRKLKP